MLAGRNAANLDPPSRGGGTHPLKGGSLARHAHALPGAAVLDTGRMMGDLHPSKCVPHLASHRRGRELWTE